MRHLHILFATAMIMITGCSASTRCAFNDKTYDDGASVFLRERQNVCICEDDHWICLPAMGAVRSGELNAPSRAY